MLWPAQKFGMGFFGPTIFSWVLIFAPFDLEIRSTPSPPPPPWVLVWACCKFRRKKYKIKK